MDIVTACIAMDESNNTNEYIQFIHENYRFPVLGKNPESREEKNIITFKCFMNLANSLNTL